MAPCPIFFAPCGRSESPRSYSPFVEMRRLFQNVGWSGELRSRHGAVSCAPRQFKPSASPFCMRWSLRLGWARRRGGALPFLVGFLPRQFTPPHHSGDDRAKGACVQAPKIAPLCSRAVKVHMTPWYTCRSSTGSCEASPTLAVAAITSAALQPSHHGIQTCTALRRTCSALRA